MCTDETIKELHELVNTPVPKGEILQSQIEIVTHIDASRPYFVLTMPLYTSEKKEGGGHGEIASSTKEADSSKLQSFEMNPEKRIAIITAKKCGSSIKPHFVLTLEPEDFTAKLSDKPSKWYFGKLKYGKVFNTRNGSLYISEKTRPWRSHKTRRKFRSRAQFILYDRGYNPKKKKTQIFDFVFFTFLDFMVKP